ncbi:GvpL/GvpF family gas vesicle protein [Streptomyces sp. HNM0574]|uniref:GvpL/GvpF family gas vesicle protein n=1 Tax=Streptomyces sp. HNM0574 TaxID=2714954 RepID=UPI00146D90D4|nr:GvpL/GvpF family gas vesicle protein [Streptomyces sp. HNM0574]NLU70726.1 GvpL/GvpF family gas vesicle protein [Streptomyces sp. HNM0574]
MTPGGVYAYGVVRAGWRLPGSCRGVGSPPAEVRLLAAGSLAAVVSDVPEGLRARRRDLLAHQDLLLALADRGPVVPMRFGMVAPDEETLAAGIAGTARETEALLDHLDGRCEINVKVSAVEEGLAALVREDESVRRLRELARSRPGYEASLRLGEAVAAGLNRRAAEAAEETVRQLDRFAADRAEAPASAECVRNVSFLVDRDRLADVTAAVERLAAEQRGRAGIRLTGPLPCYSFAESVPAGAGG